MNDWKLSIENISKFIYSLKASAINEISDFLPQTSCDWNWKCFKKVFLTSIDVFFRCMKISPCQQIHSVKPHQRQRAMKIEKKYNNDYQT